MSPRQNDSDYLFDCFNYNLYMKEKFLENILNNFSARDLQIISDEYNCRGKNKEENIRNLLKSNTFVRRALGDCQDGLWNSFFL